MASRRNGVEIAMDDLQKLVVDRLAELDLSFREAAEQSHGKVSTATLNNLALGRRVYQPKPETIDGIALALDLPVSVVRKAATSAAKTVEFRLPKRADKLTPQQRAVVLAMVDALLQNGSNASGKD